MSDENTTVPAQTEENTGGTEDQAIEQPTFTQAQVNEIISKRVNEVKAKTASAYEQQLLQQQQELLERFQAPKAEPEEDDWVRKEIVNPLKGDLRKEMQETVRGVLSDIQAKNDMYSEANVKFYGKALLDQATAMYDMAQKTGQYGGVSRQDMADFLYSRQLRENDLPNATRSAQAAAQYVNSVNKSANVATPASSPPQGPAKSLDEQLEGMSADQIEQLMIQQGVDLRRKD